MKKIFTLFAAAILGFCGAQAQTVTVTKTDGTKTTFNASEIQSIEFAPAEEKVDTTVFHSFGAGEAYILVSSQYFNNSYYGNQCTMDVLKAGDQYLCRFTDPTWGKGLFNITLSRGSISGTGKFETSNPQGGSASSYDATISGSMTNIKMNIAMGRMGDVTINWIYGKTPEAYTIAGTYTGKDSVNVGGAFPYWAENNPEYVVTASSDSTIDVTVPEEVLEGTVMGQLTLGTYTIKNIKWDAEAKAFKHNYKNDNVVFHFKAVNADGQTTYDTDYTMGVKDGVVMEDDICNITVTPAEDGSLTITNNYKMGHMPFPITNTYKATKKAATGTTR